MGGEAEELGFGIGENTEILRPWEQHSKVISIPRFDYKAPSSLLECSHSGFLITCPIKREKSATKEAISILEQFSSFICNDDLDSVAAKRRKLCPEEAKAGQDRDGHATEEGNIASGERDQSTRSSLTLSLVKLTRSGLLLFTFPSNNVHQTVDMLARICQSLESGDLKKPLWCHRIFPIQESCVLTEEGLQLVVSKLFQEHWGNDKDKLETSIKFAVGFNRRGIDEEEAKFQKSTAESKGLTLLDRDKCFEVVAGAVKAVAKKAIVDLKSPEVVVLVELLPLSGVPHGSLVAGVGVLPHCLVTTKPRLCVKPLVSDPKAMKTRS